VPVEVLAGAVVAHGGAWVGVPGGDLDVAQVDAGVETGREQCSNPAEYVGVGGTDPSYSSWWVIAGAGQFGDVAVPLASPRPRGPNGPLWWGAG
jgi:hypothetical protein